MSGSSRRPMIGLNGMAVGDTKSAKAFRTRYLQLLWVLNMLLVCRSCCPWSHGLQPKKLKLVWWCHQLLSGFPAKDHLPRGSQSVTSVANYKSDYEMIPGAVHRYPGICLTTEENPKKPQLGDRLMKRLCDHSSPQMRSHSSKWGR